MSRYRLTRKARSDLTEIGRYTARNWGRAQRDEYLTRLYTRFDALAESPQLGLAIDHIIPGCRAAREGSHFIAYSIDGRDILILRVLHARMDLAARLRTARENDEQ